MLYDKRIPFHGALQCSNVGKVLSSRDGNRLQLDNLFPFVLIESMMGLRQRQGNLRQVFRLFSLMRGLPSIRLK